MGPQSGTIRLLEIETRNDSGGRLDTWFLVEVEIAPDAAEEGKLFLSRMSETCRLRPARERAFERALLAAGRTPTPIPGRTPVYLPRAATVADLARSAIGVNLQIFLYHEPGVRLGEDAEAVHDMRVACRRILSILRIYEGYLPGGIVECRKGLRKIADSFGEVRDLEVRICRIGELRDGLTIAPSQALAPLTDRLKRTWEVKRKKLLRILDSEECARTIAALSSLIESSPAPAPAKEGTALLVLPGMLRQSFRNLQKRRRKVTPDSPAAAYHRVRIQGKKTRYALESTRPLYGEVVEGPIRALTRLQDLLGRHQDAEIDIAALRKMAAEDRRNLPAETVFAMGEIARCDAEEAAAIRSRFPRQWKRLRAARWKRMWRAMGEAAASAAAVAAEEPDEAAAGAGAPVVPIAPVPPIEPATPVASAAPMVPAASGAQAAPIVPAAPAAHATPITPAAPAAHATPITPAPPVTPAQEERDLIWKST